MLVALTDDLELFHTTKDEAFAVIPHGAHKEVWSVRGPGFNKWLRREYWGATDGAPSGSAVTDALGVIEARALFDGPEEDVFTRIAGRDGAIYLDLADQAWRAVRITPAGWEVVSDPPARFRRAPGMLPLPEPVTGGSIDALLSLLNVASDEDGLLLVATIIAMFAPDTPYPVLEITGEQGSARPQACG